MGRPGPGKLGSKRPGRSRTSNTPGRSMKRTLQPRYATHLVRSRGVSGRRAGANSAKTEPAMKTSLNAIAGTTGVRVTAWGERTGRVNWGPSAAGGLVLQPDGIIHNPLGGRQRRRCGHSKRRACRTEQPVGEPRATGRVDEVEPASDAGRKPDYGIKRARRRPKLWQLISLRRQRRSLLTTRLKPYWGKPTVRNLEGAEETKWMA